MKWSGLGLDGCFGGSSFLENILNGLDFWNFRLTTQQNSEQFKNKIIAYKEK